MSELLPRISTALGSRYSVKRQVGAGGMATVYLASDLRHDRDVAIKVLHPDLAAALGAERFLAEIKTTAKLQHPHILPLLDSGESDGLLFYVMPYVAGETLRARLERETQLPVDDAIRIAREVASALESAHRQGVVHRDIKPENILLHEEQALVTDFGIALAVSAAGGPRMTQTGLSLGTPAYMAPEQAMGERAIDLRADIYALGAVLYEMLVGEVPFSGPTVQAIVARVMTEHPRPITSQRRSVPAHVNAVVMRALEKLPADRFHTAAEMSAALVNPAFDSAPAAGEKAPRIRVQSLAGRPIVAWSVAGVALAAALATFATAGSRDRGTAPMQLSIDLESGELPLDATEGLGISADGSMVALTVFREGQSRLVLRALRQDGMREIGSSARLVGSTEFSPDGRWIVYNASERILKAPVSGGAPIDLGPSRWAHMTWAGNDAIIHTTNYDSGLHRMSAEGRDTATLTTPNRAAGELGHWWPQLLPGGRHVLFTNFTTPADRSKVEVLDLETRERRVVLEGGFFGRYSAGYLFFARGNAVMVVPFDPGSRRTTGTPEPLELPIEINATNGWAGFAVSPAGILVYRRDPGAVVQLAFLDESGLEEAAIEGTARYTEAAASPDGRSIAIVRDGDVWVFDRQRRVFTRITRTEQREQTLVWSRDSREIIYTRDVPQFDIFGRPADGSGPERVIVTSPDDKDAYSVTPDGEEIVYSGRSAGAADVDLLVAPLRNRADSSRILVAGPGGQRGARFSPDGRWLTYMSEESGQPEVYLAPYPLGRGPRRQQLSLQGGLNAHWSPDGRTVYFESGGRVHRVRLDPGTGEAGNPELLRRIPQLNGWTVAPDGRLLSGRIPPEATRRSIRIVLDWPALLSKPSR